MAESDDLPGVHLINGTSSPPSDLHKSEEGTGGRGGRRRGGGRIALERKGGKESEERKPNNLKS